MEKQAEENLPWAVWSEQLGGEKMGVKKNFTREIF